MEISFANPWYLSKSRQVSEAIPAQLRDFKAVERQEIFSEIGRNSRAKE